MFTRVLVATTLCVIATAPSRGQTPSPKPGTKTAAVHWILYVNKEFRFSFWYPNAYRPTSGGEICKDNQYRRYLLCLERPDDPDSSILVTLIVADAFQVHPLGNGDDLPVRRRIGHHDFYCGVGGSMGAGFGDECLLDLRGKTLEITFYPSQTKRCRFNGSMQHLPNRLIRWHFSRRTCLSRSKPRQGSVFV